MQSYNSDKRFVYCIDEECDGSDEVGVHDNDPECECGNVMTDVLNANAALDHETAVVVAQKANNDPNNQP